MPHLPFKIRYFAVDIQYPIPLPMADVFTPANGAAVATPGSDLAGKKPHGIGFFFQQDALT